jgi:hypothetical protein
MMDMKEKVREVLQPLRESLNADGADLIIETLQDNIRVEIAVSEQTCVECLLPEHLINNIIQKKLLDNGIQFSSLDLIYPAV